jgi:hypothetical protein
MQVEISIGAFSWAPLPWIVDRVHSRDRAFQDRDRRAL